QDGKLLPLHQLHEVEARLKKDPSTLRAAPARLEPRSRTISSPPGRKDPGDPTLCDCLEGGLARFGGQGDVTLSSGRRRRLARPLRQLRALTRQWLLTVVAVVLRAELITASGRSIS